MRGRLLVRFAKGQVDDVMTGCDQFAGTCPCRNTCRSSHPPHSIRHDSLCHLRPITIRNDRPPGCSIVPAHAGVWLRRPATLVPQPDHGSRCGVATFSNWPRPPR
ncbi:hypothetical protein X942_5909 [Burkholderia pseudomallei MSHR5596]|nr:hypothetical protein X942_5909 [Burkholderia pseudomallei MSHR5596]